MQDRFYREIEDFLLSGGVHCEEVRAGSIIVLKARLQCRGLERELYILPAGITARTPEEAMSHRSERLAARKYLESLDPRTGIVTVAEDRWRRLGELYRKRLLAHLGDFRSIFARKCRAVRTIRWKDCGGRRFFQCQKVAEGRQGNPFVRMGQICVGSRHQDSGRYGKTALHFHNRSEA